MEPSEASTLDSVAYSLSSSDSCLVQDDDSEDFMYSVSNPPTPQLARRKLTSDTESENTCVSGTSNPSSTSSNTTSPEKQNSMFVNSTEAMLGKVKIKGRQ